MISEAIDMNVYLISLNSFYNGSPSEIIKLEKLTGANIPNLPRSFQTKHKITSGWLQLKR